MRKLVFAFRSPRRAPPFATVAVLSLVLSVGTICAVFALVDAALLKPLPGIADPSSLVSGYLVDARNAAVSDSRMRSQPGYWRLKTRLDSNDPRGVSE
jgi:hypothetical protein